MAHNGGCALLRLTSSLATMVRQADQNLGFDKFLFLMLDLKLHKIP